MTGTIEKTDPIVEIRRLKNTSKSQAASFTPWTT